MNQELLACLAPSAASADSAPEGGGEREQTPGAGEKELQQPSGTRANVQEQREERSEPPTTDEGSTRHSGQTQRENRPTDSVLGGERLRAHLEALRAQAAKIPGFDLAEALRDPSFVRLTAPEVGVPVADAWYALHREETVRRREQENRALLARAAAASARRPREGGGSSPALIAADYRSLSREEQLRVKKRIVEASARGEKLYP